MQQSCGHTCGLAVIESCAQCLEDKAAELKQLRVVVKAAAKRPCITFPGGCRPPHRLSDGFTESFCYPCAARVALAKDTT